MADEVDPIEAMATAHVKRIQEIADESFNSSKQLCNDVVTTVRRHAGFKSDVLDAALEKIGITNPGEKVDGNATNTVV